MQRGIFQEPPHRIGLLEAGPEVELLAGLQALGLAQGLYFGGAEQAGVIVLVPGQGQAVSLDGVGQDGDGAIRDARGPVEGFADHLHVVARQVHDGGLELLSAESGDQRPGLPGAASHLFQQLLAVGLRLQPQQGLIFGVSHVVEPAFQFHPPRPLEQVDQGAAVLEDDHLPAHGNEDLVKLTHPVQAEQLVQALAVQVDDPPQVAQVVVLPFHQRLVERALLHFRIAHQRDVAARLAALGKMAEDVILHQRAEQHIDPAQPHRPGIEMNAVAVLAAAGIGLDAPEFPKARQHGRVQVAQQRLQGMKGRGAVGFEGQPVPRGHHAAHQRGQQRNHRRGGGLVAPHLDFIRIGPHLVGVMDHVGGKPERLFFHRFQDGKRLRGDGMGCPRHWLGLGCPGHDRISPPLRFTASAVPEIPAPP